MQHALWHLRDVTVLQLHDPIVACQQDTEPGYRLWLEAAGVRALDHTAVKRVKLARLRTNFFFRTNKDKERFDSHVNDFFYVARSVECEV